MNTPREELTMSVLGWVMPHLYDKRGRVIKSRLRDYGFHSVEEALFVMVDAVRKYAETLEPTDEEINDLQEWAGFRARKDINVVELYNKVFHDIVVQ